MPNPRRRHSPSYQGRSRAHKNLVEPGASTCPRCEAPKLPHRVCPACGFYKDRPYIVKVSAE